MDRRGELVRFYNILAEVEKRIGGKKLLVDCSGRMQWPKRGVYFFFDTQESRSGSGAAGARIVRVGTHALKEGGKTKFWQRLTQHRGKKGSGNHRGSIFRLLVGEAIRAAKQKVEPCSWGVGSDPGKAAAKLGLSRIEVIDRERELEALVSRYICALPFLWLAIEDEPGPTSLRGFVERNSIALLSNYGREAVDSPSEIWLGRFSSRERVRQSGLWNNNHVDERHVPDFLDQFDELACNIQR